MSASSLVAVRSSFSKYTREELLRTIPESVDWRLNWSEFRHVATTLGALWTYDYTSAFKTGKVGYHAILKSGKHSDGFVNFPVLLAHNNVLSILARQMAIMMDESNILGEVTLLAGVPNAATILATAIAEELVLPTLALQKDADKHMTLGCGTVTAGTVCLIDDVCSSATGYREAVDLLTRELPHIHITPAVVVVLNRGQLKFVNTQAQGLSQIRPLFKMEIQEWYPDECPLCEDGSVPIKPKETEASWLKLVNGQT